MQSFIPRKKIGQEERQDNPNRYNAIVYRRSCEKGHFDVENVEEIKTGI